MPIFGQNFGCSQSSDQPRAFSDRGRSSIIRNLQGTTVATDALFPQTCVRRSRRNLLRVCMRVAEIKITLRSAIGPKITARELVSRARVYRTSARVHARRAKMARKERERRKRASEKGGKRRGKGKRAERSFASRVRSWQANV